MGRKPRVDRTPEEKWQIVQEGIKSGNVSETCRRHGIAPNLFYRWKDEAEQGAKAALGGRSAAAAETEKDHRIRQLERTLGRASREIPYRFGSRRLSEFANSSQLIVNPLSASMRPIERSALPCGSLAARFRTLIPARDNAILVVSVPIASLRARSLLCFNV